MSESKHTPWFDGNVTPKRKGVYEVVADCDHRFQHWNGRFWGYFMPSAMDAYQYRARRSSEQKPSWRGLTRPAT